MKEHELAYLAGIVDGEGHIAISKRPPNKKSGETSPGYLCYVKIGNTDFRLLEWIMATTGYGTIYTESRKRPNHKQFFTWHVTSKQAEKFLQEVHPYLIIKKNQAEMVFAMRETIDPHAGGRRSTPPDVLAKRDGIFRDLAAAHQRRAVLQSSLDMP